MVLCIFIWKKTAEINKSVQAFWTEMNEQMLFKASSRGSDEHYVNMLKQIFLQTPRNSRGEKCTPRKINIFFTINTRIISDYAIKQKDAVKPHNLRQKKQE